MKNEIQMALDVSNILKASQEFQANWQRLSRLEWASKTLALLKEKVDNEYKRIYESESKATVEDSGAR